MKDANTPASRITVKMSAPNSAIAITIHGVEVVASTRGEAVAVPVAVAMETP